ncbi:TPA: hypothetical protein N0F65_009379 [Lagenidium giganteum]|uniref:Endonuclease III homolog n=1 Tax=Lagenidium giganteum TaxID=4803 RepID=A0AAV2ZFX3_9STRA|nr:TPA: hypothetical protein N0F65_009379 [Lagenidium giganteum]
MQLRSATKAAAPVMANSENQAENGQSKPTRRTKRVRTKDVAAADDDAADASAAKNGAKKTKTKKKDGRSATSSKKAVGPPKYWEAMLDGIVKMRAERTADVDTNGAEIFYDESIPAPQRRFHVLISAMLSSQTKDPVNAAAMRRLIAHGLTIESMRKIDQKKLAELIHPVGFFNNKAKYIKQAVEILHTKCVERGCEDDIPSTFEELVELPGVGPKMAYLVMNCAWQQPIGICVDTHVHRISNRLGWVNTWNKKNPKSQDPEKTRKELEDWLPVEHWGTINLLLVGFGQTMCLPRGPNCDECKINDICPSAHKNII